MAGWLDGLFNLGGQYLMGSLLNKDGGNQVTQVSSPEQQQVMKLIMPILSSMFRSAGQRPQMNYPQYRTQNPGTYQKPQQSPISMVDYMKYLQNRGQGVRR